MIKINEQDYCSVYLGGIKYCKGYFGGNLIFGCSTNSSPEENQPPTIGDIDLYVEGGVITPITYETFVAMAAPPYNDPEGDLMDAVKITFIDPNNNGYYLVNEQLIYKDQVITREQFLEPNFEFVHVGQSNTDFKDDIFFFQVRDAVNGQWVD